MTPDAVLDEFRAAGALLEGHFLLSSGRHSRHYLQCARALLDPKRAARLCAALADKLRARFGDEMDCVVAPAMGGLIVGYETARQLGIASMFVERAEGGFTLRRGFAMRDFPRAIMVEDIITTGRSSREAIAAIGAAGGTVIGGACLIDRSNSTADIGVPYEALAAVDFPTFAPEQLPDDLRVSDAVKPGSRGLS